LASIQVAVETLYKLLGQIGSWNAFAVCPINEMFRRSDVPAGGYLGVARLA
jgi:hypothetical protein